MKEFEQKKQNKKKIFAPWVPFVLLVFCILTARGVWNIYEKNKESAANLAQVQNEVADLNQRKAVLEKQVNALQTNEGVEAEIRSRFQVAKPGEKVIIFDNDSGALDIQATSSPNIFERAWQKITSWF